MVAQPPIAGGCPLARARAALRREREAVPQSALARPARSEGAAQWQASTRYAAPSADLLRAACAGYVPARGGGGVAHGDGWAQFAVAIRLHPVSGTLLAELGTTQRRENGHFRYAALGGAG